jgi:RNA recognition motif-containing protein
MNLFVSNIDYKISEDELRKIFEQYGEVKSVKILMDLETKKAKDMVLF